MGSVVAVGRGSLRGFGLAWDKVGKDGSGKCCLEPDRGEARVVWGVVFDLAAEQLPLLDAAEGCGHGYERDEVTVEVSGRQETALTYLATRRDADRLPYHWYKGLVAAGAAEHELPPRYRVEILSTPSVEDTDRANRRRNEALLKEILGRVEATRLLREIKR